ncbi:TetR/AcrR family transcriptional regulator [Paractinoplanes brasiliensis]|uniref:TetR family transcriptional regulator n=1 Tax=Paractinoplanes brasiliensis TaxID=52695 RepID=A0A4R6J8X4_9ACTN|nr:TetR family transcriptional regulator [Actinoplanes brasiliensis]TDO31922.1 TetR family transcriptional regulator [Actinoplanes brasiliensis]GID27965.1 TetR family transcriptional regulator [Actinoplanes brasiliensis]
MAHGRREELLEKAYAYVRESGISEMSLRPLAAAIGTSPRVLLFLFESKDGLIRALLTRARRDELLALDGVLPRGVDSAGLAIWEWLSDPANASVLRLWVEAYARSLGAVDGPWTGFAAETVADWLDLLSRAEPGSSPAHRTAVLAVLRGALLDVLATGDVDRVTAGVRRVLAS